jgi:formamidopyrimidine-DNA glycosylase
MPEGPQVFQTAQKLRELLIDTVLERVLIFDRAQSNIIDDQSATSDAESVTSSFSTTEENLAAKVTKILTKGKRLVIILDNGQGLLLTFALSGKLEYHDKMPTIGTSAVAVMTFPQQSLFIIFRDPQKLASLTVERLDVILNRMLPTGFDPLHTVEGMREWLETCSHHPGQLVATFLTNQSMVAGIGNRYRSEIMHVAKLPPDSRIKDLTVHHLQILLISIYRVMKLASRGDYQYAVYGIREIDGQPVSKVEVAKGVFIWTIYTAVKKARKSKNTSGTVDSKLERKSSPRGRTLRQS